jgi:hypothetical protein
MRFYTKAHADYCGIDLHVHWMVLCSSACSCGLALDQRCPRQ